jgi:hypothetical protein
MIMFLGSREFVRRRFFEVFYISHIFGILLFIGAGFAHQYGVIIFISPPFFLYVCDRIIRAVRTRISPTQSVEVTVPDQHITRVEFTKDGPATKAYPGQFVFISINDGTFMSRFVNFFNWHPFTISEILDHKATSTDNIATEHGLQPVDSQSPNNSIIDLEKARRVDINKKGANGLLHASLYIKDIGNMTRWLHATASKQQLNVKVDGPYGSKALALEVNEVVTFFEAGIGITPSLTMFRDLAEKCITEPLLVQTSSIYFIWVTPSIGIYHKKPSKYSSNDRSNNVFASISFRKCTSIFATLITNCDTSNERH